MKNILNMMKKYILHLYPSLVLLCILSLYCVDTNLSSILSLLTFTSNFYNSTLWLQHCTNISMGIQLCLICILLCGILYYFNLRLVLEVRSSERHYRP